MIKVNAENFLLDNGSLATKENIFFITGNDDSVIKQVEKKLIEKAEISDTFDSFIAMPTRLFKDAWSGKKFIITNLKRTLGKVTIQTREV